MSEEKREMSVSEGERKRDLSREQKNLFRLGKKEKKQICGRFYKILGDVIGFTNF